MQKYLRFVLAFLAVSLLLLGGVGCTKVILEPADPRFVREQLDPIPGLRPPHYAPDFLVNVGKVVTKCTRGGGMPIAGYDTLLRYTKKEGQLEGKERFAQMISLIGEIHTTTNTCGDTRLPVDNSVVELFKIDDGGGSDVIAWHICHAGHINLTWIGETGIVDLDDLPQMPPIGSYSNVSILEDINNLTGRTVQEIPPEDVDEVEEAIDEAQETINWKATYQYDGCHGDGDRTTQCGTSAIHCLDLRYKDSVGSRSRRWQDPSP